MPETNEADNLAEQPANGFSNRLAVFNKYPWLRWLIIAILAIAIIIAIIFGVRAIYHHLSTNNKGTTGSSGANSGSVRRPGDNCSGTKVATPSTGGSSGNKSSQPNPQTNGPSLKSGQQLSNTGPGDVAAIFLTAAFAAASLHYLVNLRRKV